MKKLIFIIFLLITLGFSNKSIAQEEKSVSIVYKHYNGSNSGKYYDGGGYYELYQGIANYIIKGDGFGGQFVSITCYKVNGIDRLYSSYCFDGGRAPMKVRNVVGGKEYNYYINALEIAFNDAIYFN